MVCAMYVFNSLKAEKVEAAAAAWHAKQSRKSGTNTNSSSGGSSTAVEADGLASAYAKERVALLGKVIDSLTKRTYYTFQSV
jgi:hypothetical protein